MAMMLVTSVVVAAAGRAAPGASAPLTALVVSAANTSVFSAGFVGTNSLGCAISTGAAGSRVTITRAPTLVV